MNISMKLVYQYMTIFFTFSPTSNYLHPLQVEVRLERVKLTLVERPLFAGSRCVSWLLAD